MSSADATTVPAFLARAERRVALLLAIHGATTGLALALLAVVAIWIAQRAISPPGIAWLSAVVLGAVVGLARGRAIRARAAAIIESKAPQCQNLVVTADELLRGRARINPYISELIFRDAARLTASLRLADLLPVRGAVTAFAAVAALWIVAATRHADTNAAVARRATAVFTNPSIGTIDVEVTNPAYIGGAPRLLHDPARIEALAGSRIRLSVHADAASIAMETLDGNHTLAERGSQLFSGEFRADADGYVALEPVAAQRHGPRRLIGVSVIPDHPPAVHVTAPGHDIKLTDGKHTIDLALDASDDNALVSLRLRYTKVSGSGERFTFTQGDVPLTITRVDARNWKGHAAWRLDTLALEPGDMVVYRAVATDGRPGAPAAESDSYIAEVLAPGGIAAAGFAVDPEAERYALSEQMVILKSEKLLARKGSLTAAAYADEAAGLAAEQRSVRAVFVFMMGGEVGGADDATGDLNEEAEASGEGDLAVQRMLNQGRDALLNAIRAMSHASTALTTPDVATALTHERMALAQVEKTFAHSHIILRALTERERIDLTRRLTGTLTEAASDAEPAIESDANPRATALRRTLSDIAILAAAGGSSSNAARASALAESVLRADPSSLPAQRVAATLDSAATALNASRTEAARLLLDHAATGVAGMLRSDLFDAPFPATSGDVARLGGALTDALRHRP